MGLFPSIKWPVWTKNVRGDTFTDITSYGKWAEEQSNLAIAQNHPILTPAILFVAKLFSQATFSVEGKLISGKSSNKIIKLLNNPNQYQTKQDFLETLMFVMIAQGVAIVARQRIIGFEDTKFLFVLNKDLIEWPEEYNSLSFRKNIPSHLDKYIVYDKDGENIKFKISDLMFFYDLPNMLHKNPFKVKSRLDGLKQTLLNTQDSLIAKNIIVRSNGKEMVTGKKEGFPLTPEEKKDIERMFNHEMGLAFNRKRGVVTKADLTWKSLHIALRDLGLDESVKIDGNLIYTGLHIPKDILSLEAKKTTYNNFKESMVSYVQNEMQASLNSFTAVLNKYLSNGEDIIGDYSHLPIMQFILLEKYEVVIKQATALRALISTGIPQKIALRMCGFDENTELGPMLQLNATQQDNSDDKQEEKDWLSRLELVG